MRRATRSKRLGNARNQDRATFSLMVHGPEYGSGEEVVINPECFPQIKVHDLVEIAQPEREHQRLVLQVTTLAPVRGKLEVSVLKDIAAQFRLDPLAAVTVQRVDARDVTVDFIELSFKDQFLSRADLWRFKVAMLGRSVYVGKSVACLGVRSQVEGLLASHHELSCGVIGAETKMIVRSRSSRLFWLVQMSAEMYEFAPDGELYYEKLLDRFVRVMVAKWHDSSVSHSVTIIAFSRSFYDAAQFPVGYDPRASPFAEPTQQGLAAQCRHCNTVDATTDSVRTDSRSRPDPATAWSDRGPTIQVDPLTGRYYEDFYKVLVMNYTGPDWDHLLALLKREFTSYYETHRWRSPEEFIAADYNVHDVDRPAVATQTANPVGGDDVDSSNAIVHWRTLPYGVPSRAIDGNSLEAINVTLNILDKHYMDRDLHRTGQSIVMLTAGSSIFHVDARLAQITKQRMMDNGVGMDMISLTTPPTHVVPLFIYPTMAVQPTAADVPSPSPGHQTLMQRTDDSTRRERKNHSLVRAESLCALATASPPTLEGLERELNDFDRWTGDDDDSDDSNPSPLSECESTDGDAVADNGDDGGAARSPREQQQPIPAAATTYSVPHWVNITFLDFDCRCRDSVAPRSHKHHHPPPPPTSTSSSTTTTTSATRRPPASVSSNASPTSARASSANRTGASSAAPLSSRLLSHRVQTCACQVARNQQFLPLPPCRMFDLAAPTERLSFPVALKKLIRGYPRRVASSVRAADTTSIRSGVDVDDVNNALRRRLRLSDVSDADSDVVSNAVVGAASSDSNAQSPAATARRLRLDSDSVQICRSPDFDCTLLSPQRLAQCSSVFAASMLRDVAFEDYDAEVFSVPCTSTREPCVPSPPRLGCSPPRHDVTSATFSSSDILPLEAAMAAAKQTKWIGPTGTHRRGLAASSSNMIRSLLSPRTDVRALRTLGFGGVGPNSSSNATVTPLKPLHALQRVAAHHKHSSASPSASLGVAIPTVSTPHKSSAAATAVVRKDSVFPQREVLRGSYVLAGSAAKRSSVHGSKQSTGSSGAIRTRATDSAGVETATSPTSPLDTHALLLSKSFDSSSRRFVPAASAADTRPLPNDTRRRQRASTSNVESSSTPPVQKRLLMARESSFQHQLSQSMTMALKPSPSYYNDLLLRSPPPSGGVNAAASASPLPMHHDASSFSTSVRPNYTPGTIRRGHSDVLTLSALAAAGTNAANASDRSSATQSTMTNPFKYSTETLECASQRLTSDRRRWSHLFPVLSTTQQATLSTTTGSETPHPRHHHQHGGVTPMHLGPNWKSLTSPAILPLTTDYYPSPKELHTSYTESFYTLTLPSMRSETVPTYTDHAELLTEMVCQRLASDFQLVATDLSTDAVDPALQHQPVAAAITHRGPSGESRAANNSVIYYLSMGHRIHQMIYDPELQTIDVKRYFQRDAVQSATPVARTYRYSLFVDRTQSFTPLQQTFHEFRQPEENWNALDHLLCGYYDEMADVTKCRRIRFAVVPPRDAADSAVTRSAYAAKFLKLIEFLQTRIAPADDGVTEKIRIRIATGAIRMTQDAPTGSTSASSSPSSVNLPQQCGTLRYKISCKSSSCASARSKSDDARAEWIMVHLEDEMDAARCYHLDMRWLACSGIVADEFVSTLKRKSKQSGLELRRVPEYSRVSFLQIHPLIAPIFLPLQRSRSSDPRENTPERQGPNSTDNNNASNTSNTDDAIVVAGGNSSSAESEQERVLIGILVDRLDFVLDDERLADANGIGYGLGIEREERKPLGAAGCISSISSGGFGFGGGGSSGSFRAGHSRAPRRSASTAARLLAERWRTRGYKQYMHRSAPVFLRLVPRGLVWIPSYDYDERSDAARVDELFREICRVVQASAALRDLVDSCCCTEAA